MNTEYLYSIINLYLKKEKDTTKANLSIQKKDDVVEFSFNMDLTNPDKTVCKLPLDDFNLEIWKILNIYKQDIMIIDEKYSEKGNNYYEITLQNGRKLSFSGFTLLEINNIRNNLYNITINSDEIKLNDLDKEKKMVYQPLSLVEQAGFIATSNIFLTVLYLVDLFAIILWIFKVVTK